MKFVGKKQSSKSSFLTNSFSILLLVESNELNFFFCYNKYLFLFHSFVTGNHVDNKLELVFKRILTFKYFIYTSICRKKSIHYRVFAMISFSFKQVYFKETQLKTGRRHQHHTYRRHIISMSPSSINLLHSLIYFSYCSE